MSTDTSDQNPILAIDARQSRTELARLLEEHRQHLQALPASASAVDRARIELDIAEVLQGLGLSEEAWQTARAAFDVFVEAEDWQEAVEACDILYQTEQPDSIVALGNGVWLAVTYPIKPQTTVAMLHHIVDETPSNSDGGAVAAAVAHYIADIRTEGKQHESLTFLTAQILGQVAKRHRNIEDPKLLNIWMAALQLNEPAELLPRLAQILDAIVEDRWWYDRDALRARLPVN